MTIHGEENEMDQGHGLENEHMHDDHEHLEDQEGEFNGEQQSNLNSAGEAIAARHLEGKRKKAAQLARKYKKDGPPVLSKAWLKSLHPIEHIKKNWKEIAMATTAGAALATVGTVALADTPNVIAVAKTAVLAYPGWKILEGGMASVGFYTGHALNAFNRDRFREIKTEPAGMWAGRILALSMAFSGGVLGNGYMDTVKDFTVNLPTTITQSIPSGIVDTFTHQSNTKWDPVWELPDQGTCLLLEQMNPDHVCLDGPGSDGIIISIDEATLQNFDQDTEISHMGRALEKTGIDFKAPDFLPDMPSNDNMNDWALDKLGIESSPKMQMQ